MVAATINNFSIDDLLADPRTKYNYSQTVKPPYYLYLPKKGCKPGKAGLMDYLELQWYRFELQTAIYMLDRNEKLVVCNIIAP